jgi:hypothetical protein
MKTAALTKFASMHTSDDEDDVDDDDDDEIIVGTEDIHDSASTTTAGLSAGLRRRAFSMAETQPSVETVIVKAKRAAQSLWMLLHAQVRTCVRACYIRQ